MLAVILPRAMCVRATRVQQSRVYSERCDSGSQPGGIGYNGNEIKPPFLTFKLIKIVCHSCSCGYRPTILLGIYVNLLFFSRKNLKNEIYKVNFIVNSFFGLDDYYI